MSIYASYENNKLVNIMLSGDELKLLQKTLFIFMNYSSEDTWAYINKESRKILSKITNEGSL